MGIKYSLGRIELKSDLENIFGIIEKSGFGLLPITPEHILASIKFDLHHKDREGEGVRGLFQTVAVPVTGRS